MSDIAELFARDPLNLTREDVKSIVDYYREKRQQFKLSNDKAAGATKKMKEDKPKIKPSAAELLGKLGLLKQGGSNGQ